MSFSQVPYIVIERISLVDFMRMQEHVDLAVTAITFCQILNQFVCVKIWYYPIIYADMMIIAMHSSTSQNRSIK